MWVPDKNKTGGFSIYDRDDEEINKYNEEKIFKIEFLSKIFLHTFLNLRYLLF